MSSGTMGDPGKCTRSKDYLKIATGAYVFGTSLGVPLLLQQRRIEATFAFLGLPTAAVYMGSRFVDLVSPGERTPRNIFGAIKNVWQDCDGGGWLKKNLDSAKEKMNAGLDKVGEKLFPDVNPTPDLAPVTTKMVESAAAIRHSIRWAEGFKSLGWGVATIGTAALTALAGSATAAAAVCPFDGPAGEIILGAGTAQSAMLTATSAGAFWASSRNFISSLF